MIQNQARRSPGVRSITAAIISCVMLVFVTPSPSAGAPRTTLVSIPWGRETGQIGYYSISTDPQFSQSDAEGPGGVARSAAGEIWISDRFNDRILRFGPDGKLLVTIETVGAVRLKRPGPLWIGDHRGAVVDRESGGLVIFDPTDMKAAANRILVPGDGIPYRQIEAVIGSGDRLHLGDFALSQIVDVSFEGKVLGVNRWDLTGLALDPLGALTTLEYRADERHVLIRRQASGVWTSGFTIPSKSLGHPYLLGIDGAGRTYIRTHQNDNVVRVYEIEAGGEPRHFLGEFPLSPLQQQFVPNPAGGVVGLIFDAEKAPEGMVEVIQLP